MRFVRTLLVGAMLYAGSAHAAAVPRPTAAERAATDLAARRGALLYSYDQAAWHGTDDMLAKVDKATFRSTGWIVDGPSDAPELVFFDNAAIPHALYIARFHNGKLTGSRSVKGDADAALTPTRLRMIAALKTAREAFVAQKVSLCGTQRPNTVVLPPETPDGPILVYLLAPQPDAKTVSFGGNYRVAIAADGSAGTIHPFANSCITASPDAAKGKPAILFITHLLDPVPTEIHVFQSLVLHLPVAVATMSNDYVWAVDGTRIALVSVLPRKR